MNSQEDSLLKKNAGPLIIGGCIIIAGVLFGVISRPTNGPTVSPSTSSPGISNSASTSFSPASTSGTAENSKQLSLLRRMLVDQVPYYGKDVTLTLSLSPDTYYNYKYSEAKDTHYSFKVADADGIGGGMYIYAARSKFSDLFNFVVDNPSTPVRVTVTASPSNGDPQTWDLVSWSK